jgi:uncharacterized membrane protein
MKKWQCKVCGYIHEGDEPPETCPICGADKSKFIEVAFEEKVHASPEPETETASPEAGSGEESRHEKFLRIYDMVTALMTEHHLHPISVHIPNGVLPLSVFFAMLSVMFGAAGMDIAAFYSLIYVLLAMPMVLFSGYNDWKRRYGGNMTNVFFTKMICGAVVFCLALILVFWRLINPEVAASSARGLYLMIYFVMLGAAGVAGHLGGKLVFGKK